MKQPGRVGSCCFKGAGFDFKTDTDEGAVATLCTGHGENLIETLMANRISSEMLEYGFIEKPGHFLRQAK